VPIPENQITRLQPRDRVCMPTISSLLPAYTNSDPDFINGAFSAGALQNIKDVPNDLRAQAIIHSRRAVQAAAVSSSAGMSGSQANKHFSGGDIGSEFGVQFTECRKCISVFWIRSPPEVLKALKICRVLPYS
jgi:hypothetical protein